MMNSTTSGFALSAAITILFNTALAWAKDAYPPLNTFMKSLTGHHWTTHGLADLFLFIGLGLIFSKSGIAEKINPARLAPMLAGTVVVAFVGLALWYLFV
jgi:hypothetical protein